MSSSKYLSIEASVDVFGEVLNKDKKGQNKLCCKMEVVKWFVVQEAKHKH